MVNIAEHLVSERVSFLLSWLKQTESVRLALQLKFVLTFGLTILVRLSQLIELTLLMWQIQKARQNSISVSIRSPV